MSVLDATAPVLESAAPGSAARDWSRAEVTPTRTRARARATPDLGAAPIIVLAAAAGVALVSVGFALARTGATGGPILLWAGLALIFLPAIARLVSPGPLRAERIAVTVVLALALYLVKVLRDPFAFTYGDELVHQHNVMDIQASGRVFGDNPIIPISPLYPGLHAVTAALSSATGLSTFVAGLIVIGAARVILVLALFLLIETVMGSTRLAGIAVALYAAAPNYLFFTAQFAYESLALPLGILAALAVVRARPASGRLRADWAIVAVLATAAVAVSHHITAYALVVFLALACVVPTVGRARRPWLLAAVAAALVLGWLALVASRTIGYLAPVLTGALHETLQTAAGETAPRQLFHSTSGTGAPPWERLVGVGSTLLIVCALPVGLLAVWARHRRSPYAVVLACAGVAYVGTLALRFVPAAWETGARASEFLFIGVAVLLACAALAVAGRRLAPGLAIAVVCAGAGLVFVGGVVGGSSAQRRVAEPYRVAVPGGSLDPSGVQVARWVREVLGPRVGLAAQDADARMLLVHGAFQRVATGSNPPISGIDPPVQAVLETPQFYRWQLDLLRRREGVDFVVVDTRKRSLDVMEGYYFRRGPLLPQDVFPSATLDKFERAGADRIYDSGDIVVDDISGVRDAATTG